MLSSTIELAIVELPHHRPPEAESLLDGFAVEAEDASRLTMIHLRDETLKNCAIQTRFVLTKIEAEGLRGESTPTE